MDRGLEIRDGRIPALAQRASLRTSPFVRRSVGVLAIGLVNLLVLAALGVVLFLLLQIRTPRPFWRVEFVDSAMSAMLMALTVLFVAFMVLGKQGLLQRATAGIVVLFFLAVAFASPGIEHAAGLEHFIVFWLSVVIFIPLRALGSWSIHWSDEMPARVGAGQFSLVDLLSWTTAIAATIGFLRVLPPSNYALWFSCVQFRSVAAVIIANCVAISAAFVVVGPSLWLAASRASRVRGGLWITSWIVAVSILWCVAILIFDYVYRGSPWALPWWYMVLYGFESLLYLLVLEAALLGNLFALEWLGVRWTRATFSRPNSNEPASG